MKVLIIEDEEIIRKRIEYIFTKMGHTCESVKNLYEADQKIQRFGFDLITLDLMFTFERGESFIRKIRRVNENVPILIISAISDIERKISLIKAGADDYLVKPFSEEELVVRAESMFKKYLLIQKRKDHKTKKFKNILFNWQNNSIKIDSIKFYMTNKEKTFLEILANEEGLMVEKSKILITMWGKDSKANSNRLGVIIKRLRDKTIKECSCNLIENMRNVGYRLIIETILKEQTGFDDEANV